VKILWSIILLPVVVFTGCTYGEGHSTSPQETADNSDHFFCTNNNECSFKNATCSHIHDPSTHIGDILGILPLRTPCVVDQECLCFNYRCEYSDRELFESCLTEREDCITISDEISQILTNVEIIPLSQCHGDCELYSQAMTNCTFSFYYKPPIEDMDRLEDEFQQFDSQNCCRFYPELANP
jgi:hypothetical protein